MGEEREQELKYSVLMGVGVDVYVLQQQQQEGVGPEVCRGTRLWGTCTITTTSQFPPSLSPTTHLQHKQNITLVIFITKRGN